MCDSPVNKSEKSINKTKNANVHSPANHSHNSQYITESKLQDLSRILQYQFSDTSLLIEALTHRSKHSVNNERLEFLGDAILGFIVAAELFKIFPQAKEGDLSRCRSALVKGETLAMLAKEFNLGEYLILGPGEMKSGGHRRDSTLADTVEAIIGAIYLDNGYEAIKNFILKCYAKRFDDIDINESLKDPKTLLQEYLQSRKMQLPLYTLVSTSGSLHEQNFHVECHVSELHKTVFGEGKSIRKAEQKAAEKMLDIVHEQVGN